MVTLTTTRDAGSSPSFDIVKDGKAVLDLVDFDIHPLTGFLPPKAPITRLPSAWESWESVLDAAMEAKLQLATLRPGEEEVRKSESWRNRVRKLPVLPITELQQSEIALRRAHHILTYLLHIYVHTLPPDGEVSIPASISLPLLQVSAELDLPPVMSYSDDILYNWTLKSPSVDGIPTLTNLRTQTSFTGSIDEEAFYLAPARVELRGAEALRIMQDILRDSQSGDTECVAQSLQALTTVIKEMRQQLLDVREACNPDFFYRNIRPWLVGVDSGPTPRTWVFEGIEQDPSLKVPTELSGSSAAQSSLIQALDAFLGIDKLSGSHASSNASSASSLSSPFATRMRLYMPRRHRAFIHHLSSTSQPLRDLVTGTTDPALSEAYNATVQALKEFRDGHMIIVTLYIIGPSKKVAREEAEAQGKEVSVGELKGSAGGDLARLLKDFRDRTTEALLP
ncbi:Indoleamine 2,3-dioxygenase [Hypsizygus marmoreus]|uniref:Indoleamine 2,3-dioxygenase n=1 Tax=Hypsizygus marmoreus TaxID=39966 RepID=A0A369K6V0_HYPMA|nr:Indoleamine 2,3-dioxygenase [Hypsizygus marmoreus]